MQFVSSVSVNFLEWVSLVASTYVRKIFMNVFASEFFSENMWKKQPLKIIFCFWRDGCCSPSFRSLLTKLTCKETQWHLKNRRKKQNLKNSRKKQKSNCQQGVIGMTITMTVLINIILIATVRLISDFSEVFKTF